ncbi:LTA synthase family protein [Aureivirga sp. CE67]|uniref:LTA synthase family protein n=1 Tax=Aureivirga sp. CE67 TaxID=1788983 RepID=UPI0018C93EA6|nr:alkaline phosphatase family protein [Aureivirga sp. CE67]
MKINPNSKLILKLYLLVLSIFTLFRFILFFYESDKVDLSKVSISTIFQSFVMGVRFDIVISSYILILPVLILSIMDLLKKDSKYVKKFIFYWTSIFFIVAFAISSADIPYFSQFYERFSVGAFEWMSNFDIVFSMIFSEPQYYSFFIFFILLAVGFVFMLKKILLKEQEISNLKTWKKATLMVCTLLIIAVGIRGRLQRKSPIRVGTAYFCDNAFLNKLGLNPSYTLLRSYLSSKNPKNKKIDLIEGELALNNVKRYYNIKSSDYNSPIARKVEFDTKAEKKPNVVLILMESMSAFKMNRHGNEKNLTPFLDSLSNESIYFENYYTSGKHTFNGIFSSLYSFPAIYRRHSMKQMISHSGMSSTLSKNGYSTTYFTTHDGQFDNVEGFLRENGFQNIITQSDYPISEVKTSLGVPDDYMFRYSMDILDDLAGGDKPFFTTFMTTSDHGPYYVPEYFQPKSENIKDQVVEYADWSLKRFLELSSEKDWYEDTIFIFSADHGAVLEANYDIPLSYFRSPLVIYQPNKNIKQIHKNIASQVDIYPTLMGMLKIPYVNNSLGVDVINSKRDFAIINDDDKIGIIDTTFLCIYKDDEAKLYKYKQADPKNYADENPELVKEMTDYAKSNLQVYQNMLLSGQTKLEEF